MFAHKKFYLTFGIVFLLMSCASESSDMSQDKQFSKAIAEKASAIINSDDPVAKMDPFAKRDFNPFIDGKWVGNAVSYGPFREGHAPGQKGPTKAQILEDLQIIQQHWQLIRVYNADNDTENILKVIEENNLPIRVMLGIWLEKEKDAKHTLLNRTNVLRGIELANRFKDIIIAVNAGNESQVFWSWHRMDIDKLVRYLRIVRSHVSQPVTTADDYNFWNKPEAAKVAAEIDFIVTHIYPLWNGKNLATAIPWMDSTFKDINARYPDHTIVLGETGWATQYNASKTGPGEQGSLVKADVSYNAQEKYLQAHNKWVDSNQVTTFLFEAFDEPWKGGGANTPANEIEKNWGVFYKDRTMKPSFQKYLSKQPVEN
jgi:exo-beta-1,3-glucanase (GH17 family)